MDSVSEVQKRVNSLNAACVGIQNENKWEQAESYACRKNETANSFYVE